MTRLSDINNSLGIEYYINCLLVFKDVRPGMFIQPVDYKERTAKDPNSKLKIRTIKTLFPSLNILEMPSGEILISKIKYTLNDIQTNLHIGKAIGYPCAEEYQWTINHINTDITYGIRINAILSHPYESAHILANTCKDLNKLHIFNDIAFRAKEVLQSDPIIGPIVQDVIVQHDETIPISIIKQKLLTNQSLNETEIDSIDNIFFNIGFSDTFNVDLFQFNNPIHRGVVVTLISYSQNDPVEPFYPIQGYPGKDDEVNTQLKKWENDLIHILNTTRTSGGGRKKIGSTRKQKQSKKYKDKTIS